METMPAKSQITGFETKDSNKIATEGVTQRRLIGLGGKQA